MFALVISLGNDFLSDLGQLSLLLFNFLFDFFQFLVTFLDVLLQLLFLRVISGRLRFMFKLGQFFLDELSPLFHFMQRLLHGSNFLLESSF